MSCISYSLLLLFLTPIHWVGQRKGEQESGRLPCLRLCSLICKAKQVMVSIPATISSTPTGWQWAPCWCMAPRRCHHDKCWCWAYVNTQPRPNMMSSSLSVAITPRGASLVFQCHTVFCMSLPPTNPGRLMAYLESIPHCGMTRGNSREMQNTAVLRHTLYTLPVRAYLGVSSINWMELNSE